MRRLLRERTKFDRLQWSKSVWRRFHAESADRSAYGTVVVTILGAILLLAWATGNFEYFPEHAVRFTYYRIASIVSGVAMAALAVNFRHAGARHIAMWVWFLGWGAQSAAMIPERQSNC